VGDFVGICTVFRLCDDVTDFTKILGGDPTDIGVVVDDENMSPLGRF